ncbi:MAG: hypothetical protein ACHQ7M_09660 [Chloroflexota bacterium]
MEEDSSSPSSPEPIQAPPSPRSLAGELYRLLPALAIGVAALTILITLGQVLFGHGAAQPAPRAAASVESAPATVEATPIAMNTPTPPEPTAFPTVQSTVPAAAVSSQPSPTATPLPPATMDLTSIGPRRVRAQGRILTPTDRADYWFLIREPDRAGVFRQGPAAINAQGAFTFDLDLQPLNLGPDSVTLAAIPKDVSTAWTREALRVGSWLPVVEVKAENGVIFLSEVGF